MRVVTGYVDGKAQWRDEGPGSARMWGHGGRMLLAGDLVTSRVTPIQAPTIPTNAEAARRRFRSERDALIREASPRPEPIRCGVLMAKAGAPCGRLVGHGRSGNGSGHRSRASMERDLMSRRAAS